MELDQLLRQVASAAKQAGKAILEFYNSPDSTVQWKGDRSPLTEADLAAHRTIQTHLQALSPSFPILSEESEREHAFGVRRFWRTLWIVDPLDGTKEFLQRNGQFTVNIALIHEQEPLLGVVYAPALGILYGAARGLGAFREESGEKRPIQIRKPAEPPIRVVASRSHGTAEVDRYLERLPFPKITISIGSSLKFCLVAEGRADLYPRFGPTHEWDTAAGHAILLEAGGAVVDLEGKPLRYNARPTLQNPPFLAYGDDAIGWLDYLP